MLSVLTIPVSTANCWTIENERYSVTDKETTADARRVTQVLLEMIIPCFCDSCTSLSTAWNHVIELSAGFSFLSVCYHVMQNRTFYSSNCLDQNVMLFVLQSREFSLHVFCFVKNMLCVRFHFSILIMTATLESIMIIYAFNLYSL